MAAAFYEIINALAAVSVIAGVYALCLAIG